MKFLAASFGLLAAACAAASVPLPIAAGQYTFEHRFAEHPSIASISVQANITGNHIVLTNKDKFDVFPQGVIADGTLMWHAAAQQWIIGHSERDKQVSDVGGCSDGPEIVDLQQKIYWTC